MLLQAQPRGTANTGTGVNKHPPNYVNPFSMERAHECQHIARRYLGCELFSETFSPALSYELKPITVTIVVQGLVQGIVYMNHSCTLRDA